MANDNVIAAQTINPTVIEFPTRNLGAYVVLYDNSGIHALNAYLSRRSASQSIEYQGRIQD